MRRFSLPFIALAFILSAAGAAPAAHAQACGAPGDPSCPSGFVCDTSIGAAGWCVPPLPSAPASVPAQTTGIDTSEVRVTGVDTSHGSNVTLSNPLKGGSSLESFLLNILSFVINIGSIVVVLMLVYVGFKFVVARGSESELTDAKQMLLWTVIGALVLLGSKAIAMGIQATVQALSSGS